MMLNLMTEHSHAAQYFQFGVVMLKGRGGQQTRQQRLTSCGYSTNTDLWKQWQ